MKTPSLPPALERRLEPVIEAERSIRKWRWVAAGLLFAAGIHGGFIWYGRQVVGAYPRLAWVEAFVLLGVALAVTGLWFRAGRADWDVRRLARRIEADHPDLQAALLTALDAPESGGVSRYLHERVVAQAVRHGISHDWLGQPTRRRVTVAKASAFVSVMVLLALQGWILFSGGQPAAALDSSLAEAAPVAPTPELQLEVRPGDVELERGGRLVVEARFSGGVPESPVLAFSKDEAGREGLIQVNLKASVEAGNFGGVLTKVDHDGHYRVLYGAQSSKVYRVTTYEHPALVESDAVITPPAYSGQPVKEVKKTRNVTVLEGSQVKFRMKVNKPVVQAELYGEDKSSHTLVPSKDDPLVLEGSMEPEGTQRYRLHLVDAQDRGNKQPPWFKVSILEDQLPKVEIVFPKRDLTVSPIQEMPVETKVWDDLGVKRAGAVFMLGSETREVVLGSEDMKGRQHHELATKVELEKLNATPRQLLSYYVWAEDVGPKGAVRRSQSDMFFAEVRHFEDIFREGESPGGEAGGEGGGSPAAQLGKLQKEILNATWKVVREAGKGRKFEALANDMGVVAESQALALRQTETALEEVEDEEVKAALSDARAAMEQARKILESGMQAKDLQANSTALAPERQALEALYRAQSREHQVMRNQQAQSSGASNQSSERQLMQLELKQEDKRYEEEKAAGEEQTAEQQENLQVLARLKELARRQEALAEKIKELETKLAEAKSESEKQELAQQLKRLQEEQEQLLQDVDDLQERMEQPENQATMAQEREKLEEAREQVRETAEQLAREETGSAASAATKATENLADVRDEFRERTARKFSEEMKQLKQAAEALAGNQEKLSEALAAHNAAAGEVQDQAGELESRLEETRLARQAEARRQELEKLMDRMREISEQSEPSEPLLSNSLHDAMRRAHAAGIDDALAEARDLAQFGRPGDAQASERKAAKGIEELKQSVDKAAESVLGSETEALRMARSELDRLLQEAEKDAGKAPGAQAEPGEGKRSSTAAAGETSEQQPVPGSGPPVPGGQGVDDHEDPEMAGPDADAAKSPSDGDAGKPGQGEGKSSGGEPSPSALAGSPGTPPGAEEEAPGAPGQGESPEPGPGQGQMTAAAEGEGEGKGEGKGQGESPGQAMAGGPGQGEAPGTPAQGEDEGQGQGESQGPGDSPGQVARSGQGQGQGRGQGSRSEGPGGNGGGGGGAGGDRVGGAATPDGGWFFDQPAEQVNDGAVSGAGYEDWADRLRRVEESLATPDLRERAARVQDNARNLRVDSRRNDLPPQADQVRLQVVQPLAELRDRVLEELAKREAGNPLAPLDRDPVPHRYREQVRRYYTELGAGN